MAAPARRDAGGEVGRQVAQSRVVVFALVDDETVVALGEGRVDFAELVGG
ncbi:MAG: hypothetical protein M3256_18280 [Actinomycetota bacterium]|nr:hypothetical protein [Actinomycetota bacterium]